jgi:YD repeat-containing protein
MHLLLSLKRTSLFLTLLIGVNSFGQSLRPPKVESPNAASLGRFGDIPVSLYTGTPSISIPIYTLSTGKINVPVSLRYHPASVKPSQHPGWVGSGWDLESVGSISRRVRGFMDEFHVDASWGNATSTNSAFYYPQPVQTTPTGSELANGANWSTQAQLNYNYVQHPGILDLDAQADEFSFNFLGYSGKFYYSGPANGWQVACDSKIKVEINGFINGNVVESIILSYGASYNNNSQPRIFSGFTLTTPDGTKYIFGGNDAIEFYAGYGVNPETNEFWVTPSTYMLTKIIDVNKKEINFTYTRNKPTCNLSLFINAFAGTCQQTGSGPLDGSSAIFSDINADPATLRGSIQYPVYLSSITTAVESMTFLTSDAVCMRYSDDQLKYPDVTKKNVSYNLQLVPGSDVNNIQWRQLNAIKVNNGPNLLKQFQFNYTNSTAQRLTLLSFKQLDAKNNVVSNHSFEYVISPTLPLHDGNYTDHWGFYNGTNIAYAYGNEIYGRRQPTAFFADAGMLRRLNYPTGGYSIFTWEGHDYSKNVAIGRQTLESLTGTAGGCRIAKIQNYTDEGVLASEKKYYYKKNYVAGTDPATFESSGVLNGTPKYYFGIGPRTTYGGNVTVTVSLASFTAHGNYGNSSGGSHIGYDEVAEVNLDGSYTKRHFTNYGVDLNGVSHFDAAPLGYLGWSLTEDTYVPCSSLELERGKIVGEFIYSSTNTLLQKTLITYRNDPARFNNFIKLIDINASYGSSFCVDGLLFTTANQIFSYSYYPVSKTVTTYDQGGANPVVTTSTYTYNSNNQVTTETVANSKAQTTITTNKYSNDYPADPLLTAMATANLISPIIESSLSVNGTQTSLTKANYTEPFTGLYLAQNMQTKTGTNAIETRQQVNQYDSKGNVLEVQKPGDIVESYIWGYSSTYIVAKITGADYNTAKTFIDQTMLNSASPWNFLYNDAQIRTELNKLRTNLPNALVTTYTYKPGVGITSETDPNGITTYYYYDDFSRLSFIADNDNKILKRFCYNYDGLPENCTVVAYGNDPQQATFTKSPACAVGLVTPTYTYSVPAGTYTSFVDAASANQMAINAMNTNGQAGANALSCLAPFSSINTIPAPFVVTVTSGSFTATYSVYPSSTALFLSNIPVGTYSINITPMYAGSITAQLILNGTTYTGTSFVLSNISINAATTFTLQNVPASGPCSFSMASGYGSPSNSISNNAGTVSLNLVFMPLSSPMNPGTSYTIATINGGCRPSATRVFSVTPPGGRTWQVTISPSGQMSVKITSGTSLSPGGTVSINSSYPL